MISDLIFCQLNITGTESKARLVIRISSKIFEFSINNGNEAGWVLLHTYKMNTLGYKEAVDDINYIIGFQNHQAMMKNLEGRLRSMLKKLQS